MHSLMVLLFEFHSIRAFHTICEGDCWSQGMAQQHRTSPAQQPRHAESRSGLITIKCIMQEGAQMLTGPHSFLQHGMKPDGGLKLTCTMYLRLIDGFQGVP